MPKHIGLGPVFWFEWRTASRRWQMYALRALFIVLLLVAFLLVGWSQPVPGSADAGRQNLANIGERFFYAVMGTQLTLVLLAAPAATAGSLCQDKHRGALLHLLVTDLSDTEIVLGRLAARLVPVLGMVLGGLPVLFLATFLGGIDPEALAGAFLVTLGLALVCCTLALTFSIWSSKTHEALLATYFLLGVDLLIVPTWNGVTGIWGAGGAPAWLESLNPYYLAFAPYASPGTTDWKDAAAFLAGSLVLSAILVVIAVRKIRIVSLRQVGRSAAGSRVRYASRVPRKRWGRVFRPMLDTNPVLWREWHCKQPSRWTRLVWRAYWLVAVTLSLLAILVASLDHGNNDEFPTLVSAFQVAIGLLLLSITSVTALGEERSQGCLEVLLTTPLSTRAILWGKWWGTYRTIPWLAVLPGLIAGAVAWHLKPDLAEMLNAGCMAVLVMGLVLAYGAALTSLGLALATWNARLGRALAWSVVLFLLVTVCWPLSVESAVSGSEFVEWGLVSASPFWGIGLLTDELGQSSGPNRDLCIAWSIFWLAAYTAFAALLFRINLWTFDRCLGRVSEQARRLPTPRRAHGKLLTASVPDQRPR